MPKTVRTQRDAHPVSRTHRRKESGAPFVGPSARYEISVRGRLDSRWSVWFDGVKVATKDGETVIVGDDMDQPKLRGILNKIWDLNLTLVSVRRFTAKK
jgi:hypothetical protein